MSLSNQIIISIYKKAKEKNIFNVIKSILTFFT